MEYATYQKLFNDILKYYINGYLDPNSLYYNEEEDTSYIEEEDTIPLFTVSELLTQVDEIPSFRNEIYAIDGSSRTYKTLKGNISFSSVAIVSSVKPIIGVYPGLGLLKEISINKPFIALASPTLDKASSIEPFIYTSKFITLFSPSGKTYTSNYNVRSMETELRQELETAALSFVLSISNQNDIIIVDGPLFPNYFYLETSERTVLFNERLKVLDNRSNVIGVVKRLDKSRSLVKALSSPYLKNKIVNYYKIDPSLFLSDEAFIHSLISRHYNNKPYKPVIIGPLLKQLNESCKVYLYYAAIPLTMFIPHFSVLRIETLRLNKPQELLSYIATQGFSKDGIPKLVALADSIAKSITSGISNYFLAYLRSSGVELSYVSKLEAKI
ncbi:MAG: DNA double-strand break repair nuclease NurA [Sulfolobaceae archaeon]|nr:DNA double-strand break repair nuclease NurA [Sulfolobaceae archaeon]